MVHWNILPEGVNETLIMKVEKVHLARIFKSFKREEQFLQALMRSLKFVETDKPMRHHIDGIYL